MLIRFADGQAKTLADLRAAVDAGDAGAAATARARAGRRGRQPRRRHAARGRQGARNGRPRGRTPISRRTPPLVEERAGIVFRSIGTLRADTGVAAANGPAGPAAPPADPAVLRRALRVLQEALEHADPDATAAALGALAGMPLPGSVRAAVERVRVLADEYQFEAAGVDIGALLQRHATES